MFESKTLESKIEESNVGHQMLKKMGRQQHEIICINILLLFIVIHFFLYFVVNDLLETCMFIKKPLHSFSSHP